MDVSITHRMHFSQKKPTKEKCESAKGERNKPNNFCDCNAFHKCSTNFHFFSLHFIVSKTKKDFIRKVNHRLLRWPTHKTLIELIFFICWKEKNTNSWNNGIATECSLTQQSIKWKRNRILFPWKLGQFNPCS